MDYLFLALTNPENGREADFNAWYDTHHVAEVLKYGRGFLNGRRYRLQSDPHRADVMPWSYLALYSMTSRDLRVHHEAPWTEPNPPLKPFRGLLRNDHAAWIYRSNRGDGHAHELAAHESIPLLVARAEALVFDFARVDSARRGDFEQWQQAQIERVRSRTRGASAGQGFIVAEHQRPAQAASSWTDLTAYPLAERQADQLNQLVEHLWADARAPQIAVAPLTERAICAWMAISRCHVPCQDQSS